MNIPGSSGQHWDQWDDEREIEKIATKITDIAREAYVRGIESITTTKAK